MTSEKDFSRRETLDESEIRSVPLKESIDSKSKAVLAEFIAKVENNFFHFDFINCHSYVEFEQRHEMVRQFLSIQSRSESQSFLLALAALQVCMFDEQQQQHQQQQQSKTKKISRKSWSHQNQHQNQQRNKLISRNEKTAHNVLQRTCVWLFSLWQARACTLYIYNTNATTLTTFSNGRLASLDIALLMSNALQLQLSTRDFPVPPIYLDASLPCETVGVEPFVGHLAHFCAQMNRGAGEAALGGADLVQIRARLVSLWCVYWFSVYEASGCRLDQNPAYGALFGARWVLKSGSAAAYSLAHLYQYVRNIAHNRLWLHDQAILQTWCDRIANLQTGLKTAMFWLPGLQRSGVLDDNDAFLAMTTTETTTETLSERCGTKPTKEEQYDNLIKWLHAVQGNYISTEMLNISAKVLIDTLDEKQDQQQHNKEEIEET
jgi:hypothetical protein